MFSSKAALNQVVRTLDHEVSVYWPCFFLLMYRLKYCTVFPPVAEHEKKLSLGERRTVAVDIKTVADLIQKRLKAMSYRQCLPSGTRSADLAKLFSAIDPGTTITSFTRPIIGAKTPDPANGVFSPDQAIEKMTGLLRKARRTENAETSYGGRFYDWKAERLPW